MVLRGAVSPEGAAIGPAASERIATLEPTQGQTLRQSRADAIYHLKVAFAWELTKETLPPGCIHGGGHLEKL